MELVACNGKVIQVKKTDMTNNIKPIINHRRSHTHLPSMLCAGPVVMEDGRVGRAVKVQLRLSVVLKLQPSVFSDRGRVIAGSGGYICAPIPTHRDTTNPDTRPQKAPWKTF